MVEQVMKTQPIESYHFYPPIKSYFENLKRVLIFKEIGNNTLKRIISTIERNDEFGRLLACPEYQQILDKEKNLRGNCKTGAVICIDGRIPIIHQFGRAVNVWEVAGSLMKMGLKGKYITSHLFIEVLRQNIIEQKSEGKKRDLLEIVTAHTSLTAKEAGHKCGAIAANFSEELKEGKDPIKIAIDEADKRRQAIENTYNFLLKGEGLQKQKQVAISALIDTDTMGFILNYGNTNELSTTKLLMESGWKDKIEKIVAENISRFGSMRETFTSNNKDCFIDYSKKISDITEFLLNSEEFGFKQYLDSYINDNFDKLTDGEDGQKQALKFVIARTMAVQYLTGLAQLPGKSEPDHPFSGHREQGMSISLEGRSMGRFDPKEQFFASSPDSIENAIVHIKTKLSILDKHRHGDEPDILFVSNPVDGAKSADDPARQTIRKDNGELYLALMKDEKIREIVTKGNLIIIPVLVDEDQGQVLEILDHSAYLLT